MFSIFVLVLFFGFNICILKFSIIRQMSLEYLSFKKILLYLMMVFLWKKKIFFNKTSWPREGLEATFPHTHTH